MYKYKLGVVIPTYNESGNIYKLIKEVTETLINANIDSIILVVDDNSPDGTGDIVKKLIQEKTQSCVDVSILERSGKNGLASAYIEGFTKLKEQAQYLCEMDGDFSHQPKYLPIFIEKAELQNDLVIGSRNIKGGEVIGWGKFRMLISKAGSLYSMVILHTKIYDFTGGYNLWRSSMFDTLDLQKIKAEGYLFQIEMKYKASKLGFKFEEVPIVFVDRVNGHSKFNKKIILEALLGVLRLPWIDFKSETIK
jgi:dolichol-phosphate mannosyltransferase